MSDQRYSLWLLPDEQVSQVLAAVINDVAMQYQAPVFEPHATLLGEVRIEFSELESKTRQLATQIKPFRVTLGEVAVSTTYFQSVFVRLKTSLELMVAHMKAQELVEARPNTVFMPHMSLAYGDFPIKTRVEIAQQIRLQDHSFEVDRVVITPSTPDPNDWQHLAEIKFSK